MVYEKRQLYTFKVNWSSTGGKKQSRLYSVTGYYTKKVVNWNLVFTATNLTVESYPWPVMRLSDLYLYYAEALNESGNSAAALPYLNQIRTRAGLQSIESSWANFSNQPTKYTTVDAVARYYTPGARHRNGI
jgi:hypothetical protein